MILNIFATYSEPLACTALSEMPTFSAASVISLLGTRSTTGGSKMTAILVHCINFYIPEIICCISLGQIFWKYIYSSLELNLSWLITLAEIVFSMLKIAGRLRFFKKVAPSRFHWYCCQVITKYHWDCLCPSCVAVLMPNNFQAGPLPFALHRHYLCIGNNQGTRSVGISEMHHSIC